MTTRPHSAAGSRLPLAALRWRLNEESAESGWRLHPDGVLGRALLVPAGASLTVPLKLSGEASFSGRVMLLPHDWRDGRGAVRASVAIMDVAGVEQEIWWGKLRPSDRGKPRGTRVECGLPAVTTSLRLSVERVGALRHMSVGRAIWLDPVIIDPHAPAATDPPAAPPLGPGMLPRTDAPLISVLTPVHDPPPHMLEETIASVLGQTFTDWELCLVDDGSSNPDVVAALERHAASDPRIHLKRRDAAGGISAATNTALELATGDYVALLDHDDSLTPGALQRVAEALAREPDLDMIYSDEDVMGGTGVIEHHPKPGWSPEHMSALMYTCHLGVYRRSLAVDMGGFQSRYDGCQDYDFVLRLIERTNRIAHIPEMLYHWRAHRMSTAGGDAKPYAYLAQPAAIADHLERSGVDADVQFTPSPGIHRVVHRVSGSASVDIVVALSEQCSFAEILASWLAQPHQAWNVVLVAGAAALDAALADLAAAGIPGSRITAVPAGPDGDPAAALAAAADGSTADHLLLMQAPAAGLTHDWLTRLIGYSAQPQIAAAGPVILAPDGRIQHAGIAIPEGIPLYIQYGSPSGEAPLVVYNLSAVSGVLATRREIYEELGGLDPRFGEFALIEYCLRATDTDRRVVIVPDARLRANGPDVTVNDLPALWELRDRWAQTHANDRYYNPNYRTDRGDFVLTDYS
jgi:GT2 family glycosyltransferase